MSVTVTALRPTDALVNDVISLWRRHSDTLGFFPEGAFRDYAERGQILVATTPANGLVGYLAYRRTGQRAAIIHLCVDPAHRSTGAARLLVDRLCAEARNCSSISLRCRRDFVASQLWPRLQFEAVNEVPGRGRDGGVLVVWRRDLGNPELFRGLGQDSARIRAAIDANVFFDLHDDAPQGIESRALLADWIDGAADLYVTPELLNEIQRNEDQATRIRLRAATSQYSKCEQSASGGFERALTTINSLLPGPRRPSDESDRRQLAWVVTSSAEYFLTRDEALLGASDAISERTGVNVMRPADFVRRLDELDRREEYAPARLAGTRLKWTRTKEGQDDRLADALHFGIAGESKAAFLALLRKYASDPRRFEVRAAVDRDLPIALLVLDRGDADSLRIRLLRIGRIRAATTLARHLLFKAQNTAAAEDRQVIELVDTVVDDDVEAALAAEGWSRDSSGAWRRWTMRFIGDAPALVERIRNSPVLARADAAELITHVDQLIARARDGDPRGVAEIERLLWPAKLLGAGLPTFMVPIKAGWAQHIVDERLAEQTLFGARDDLALNREAVYYRSPQKPAPSAPGRVLWYVSDDGATLDSMAIRACSAIDDVTVEGGKDAYRHNRRFGVYEWRDVRVLMDGTTDRSVMAVRFSSTELLRRPIGLAALRSIMATYGKGVMTAGPMPIDDGPFADIYRAGGLS